MTLRSLAMNCVPIGSWFMLEMEASEETYEPDIVARIRLSSQLTWLWKMDHLYVDDFFV